MGTCDREHDPNKILPSPDTTLFSGGHKEGVTLGSILHPGAM